MATQTITFSSDDILIHTPGGLYRILKANAYAFFQALLSHMGGSSPERTEPRLEDFGGVAINVCCLDMRFDDDWSAENIQDHIDTLAKEITGEGPAAQAGIPVTASRPCVIQLEMGYDDYATDDQMTPSMQEFLEFPTQELARAAMNHAREYVRAKYPDYLDLWNAYEISDPIAATKATDVEPCIDKMMKHYVGDKDKEGS